MSAQQNIDFGEGPVWVPGSSPPPAHEHVDELRVSRRVLALGALNGKVHFARWCRDKSKGAWLVSSSFDGSYMPCGVGVGLVWTELPDAESWASEDRWLTDNKKRASDAPSAAAWPPNTTREGEAGTRSWSR